MPLHWLCYRHNNSIFVVIEPAHSLIYARLRASIDGLDQGEFTEGHELDRKTTKQVPKAMIAHISSVAHGTSAWALMSL
jgi:hypothetical protein